MFVQIDEIGRILATVTTDQRFADIYPGFVWVDVDALNWAENYIVQGQVLTRPEPESVPTLSATFVPADGVSVLTISSVLPGATVQVSGPIEDEWVEESGSAEISVDVPGRYTVKVEKWPQKAVEVSFDAT